MDTTGRKSTDTKGTLTLSKEINDEIEEETKNAYVYQASITFLEPCNDIILVKAYSKEQAQSIIEENFRGVVDLNIHHLSIAQDQSVKSFLKHTNN